MAVLKDNKLRPIAYASRTLTKPERNYSTYEREALAMVDSITANFKTILRGKKFYLITDHKPLLAFMSSPLDVFGGRTLRWRLNLQEYTSKIIYIKGSVNAIADGLSRLCKEEEPPIDWTTDIVGNVPCLAVTRAQKARIQKTQDETEKKSPEKIDTDEEKDLIDLAIITASDSVENERLENEQDDFAPPECQLPEAKIITDQANMEKLVELYHDHPVIGGHVGVRRGILN